ncbi:MAG: hypothetical protein Q8K75_04490 [Chlamydiales bacterium]|nr:hypothetical protein [Chlamydiales bacterium]
MPRFVYASPILPGKSELVRHVYAHMKEHPELDRDTQQFNQLVGLDSWQSWLQKTPSRDYFIHAMEAKSVEDLFNKLQEQILPGHPRAQWLRDFYLDILGKDYAHYSAMPDIELLIDIDIPIMHADQSEIQSRAFVWPIRPNRLHDHREFCRQCAGEYRYRVHDALRQFGITKSVRYLQKTSHQDYLVVYQELLVRTPELEVQMRKADQSNPSWLWLSSVLSAHTGLTSEQLTPQVTSLTRQPISVPTAVVNPWRAPAVALT